MNRVRRATIHLTAIAAFLLLSVAPMYAEEYKFQVHNNTDTKIAKILVSEDGEAWGFFNIGSGIKSGDTVTLVWDQATNGESCEQQFKAVFANGEESQPVAFDFCESDVALEFE